MKPSKTNHSQSYFFKERLSDQLNPDHELVILSELIDWQAIEEEVASLHEDKPGQPPKPARLIIGLMILQQMKGISDEEAVLTWKENPYWQYFCGYDFNDRNHEDIDVTFTPFPVCSIHC